MPEKTDGEAHYQRPVSIPGDTAQSALRAGARERDDPGARSQSWRPAPPRKKSASPPYTTLYPPDEHSPISKPPPQATTARPRAGLILQRCQGGIRRVGPGSFADRARTAAAPTLHGVAAFPRRMFAAGCTMEPARTRLLAVTRVLRSQQGWRGSRAATHPPHGSCSLATDLTCSTLGPFEAAGPLVVLAVASESHPNRSVFFCGLATRILCAWRTTRHTR